MLPQRAVPTACHAVDTTSVTSQKHTLLIDSHQQTYYVVHSRDVPQKLLLTACGVSHGIPRCVVCLALVNFAVQSLHTAFHSALDTSLACLGKQHHVTAKEVHWSNATSWPLASG
jgi:hypothetical protein